jgi:hypothetical protein
LPRGRNDSPGPADTAVVQATATFGRAAERLDIRHRETSSGHALVVSGTDGTRSYLFHDEAALLKFESDMEQFLVRTGWSLIAFSQDHRQYADRRTFPRITTDRRRWWTDAQHH